MGGPADVMANQPPAMESLRPLDWRIHLPAIRLFIAFVAGWASLANVGATTVLYNFEPPQFTEGEVTPMPARAPSPDSSFRTDFGNAAIVGEFAISAFIPNSLFTGQSLINVMEPPSALRLTFNRPVSRLQLAFAVEQSGRLELITSLGSIVQDSRPAGGQYEGGELVLLAPSGVVAVQLSAFTDDGRPNLLAIDNLRLEEIPEPSAGLMVIGMAWVACSRRFRRVARRPQPRDHPGPHRLAIGRRGSGVSISRGNKITRALARDLLFPGPFQPDGRPYPDAHGVL